MAARLTLRRGTNLLGFENVLTRMFHCASVSVPSERPRITLQCYMEAEVGRPGVERCPI